MKLNESNCRRQKSFSNIFFSLLNLKLSDILLLLLLINMKNITSFTHTHNHVYKCLKTLHTHTHTHTHAHVINFCYTNCWTVGHTRLSIYRYNNNNNNMDVALIHHIIAKYIHNIKTPHKYCRVPNILIYNFGYSIAQTMYILYLCWVHVDMVYVLYIRRWKASNFIHAPYQAHTHAA